MQETLDLNHLCKNGFGSLSNEAGKISASEFPAPLPTIALRQGASISVGFFFPYLSSKYYSGLKQLVFKIRKSLCNG